MKNPWKKIPKTKPFILTQDKDYFNNHKKLEHKVHLELLPQPFAGDIKTAQIYLLNLNPGFHKEDIKYQNNLKKFKVQNIKSLSFKTDFYFLNEEFKNTPAYQWWDKHLKSVRKVWDNKTIRKKFMVIEFFPYHSEKFKDQKNILPSQYYGFSLVKKAILKNKTIIIMRKEKLWLKYVPELKKYPYISLINKQRTWISHNNMPLNVFDKIFKK